MSYKQQWSYTMGVNLSGVDQDKFLELMRNGFTDFKNENDYNETFVKFLNIYELDVVSIKTNPIALVNKLLQQIVKGIKDRSNEFNLSTLTSSLILPESIEVLNNENRHLKCISVFLNPHYEKSYQLHSLYDYLLDKKFQLPSMGSNRLEFKAIKEGMLIKVLIYKTSSTIPSQEKLKDTL